jgi:hypothetical protein
VPRSKILRSLAALVLGGSLGLANPPVRPPLQPHDWPVKPNPPNPKPAQPGGLPGGRHRHHAKTDSHYYHHHPHPHGHVAGR